MNLQVDATSNGQVASAFVPGRGSLLESSRSIEFPAASVVHFQAPNDLCAF